MKSVSIKLANELMKGTLRSLNATRDGFRDVCVDKIYIDI